MQPAQQESAAPQEVHQDSRTVSGRRAAGRHAPVHAGSHALDHVMSSVLACVFAHSCREFKNLNSFFAIIMGMSNPAVSRLSQTWEVNSAWSCGLRGGIPLLLKSYTEISVFTPPQKLPTKFKKFYAEFENMMVGCIIFEVSLY